MSHMITLIWYFGSPRAVRFSSTLFEVHIFRYVTSGIRLPWNWKGMWNHVACVCLSVLNEVTVNEPFQSESQKLSFAFKIPFVQSAIHIPRPTILVSINNGQTSSVQLQGAKHFSRCREYFSHIYRAFAHIKMLSGKWPTTAY